MRLLVVEDDVELAQELVKKLKKDGFAPDHVVNGIDGQHAAKETAYDVIILDLGLPDIRGLDVLTNWRKQHMNSPVLILTARDAWEEKVDGLKAGADDYLTKPFHYPELLARLQALVRRSKGQNNPKLQGQDFYLEDDSQSIVFSNGTKQELTGTEYRLLRYFLFNPEKILSKTTLTDHVYQQDSDKDSNVIEVYVKRLRKIIGKDHIETKRGQGYIYREKI